ncbi:hypothetical protein SASPL_149963 [Salvia splendens]|uniref:Transmembrane 9 superfamily member n=1 Tax=Salvia splendens TaxID=180675 RepID=A0A8X8W5R3_SALSN|nr:hypothetical protein SASPL_149963 [Salvia splendens]
MLSSGVPFGTVLALLILRFGVSGPLVFLGGYFGNRKTAFEAPVETCKIPRKIPKQPCEDYKWWWRAFLNGGSSAFFLLVYSVFYFFAKWEIVMLVCGIWYAGYIFVVLCAFFVVTGSVGFYACLWFVRMVYSSVKIE